MENKKQRQGAHYLACTWVGENPPQIGDEVSFTAKTDPPKAYNTGGEISTEPIFGVVIRPANKARRVGDIVSVHDGFSSALIQATERDRIHTTSALEYFSFPERTEPSSPEKLSKENALWALAKAWGEEALSEPENHQVFASDEGDRRKLNEICQAKHQTYLATNPDVAHSTDHVESDDQTFFVGDRIRISEGQLGTVVGIEVPLKTLHVRFDSSEFNQILLEETTDIELGYASPLNGPVPEQQPRPHTAYVVSDSSPTVEKLNSLISEDATAKCRVFQTNQTKSVAIDSNNQDHSQKPKGPEQSF